MKLDNHHRYTTRSLRSVLTWAWNRAKKDLTPAQRDRAGNLYLGTIDVVEAKVNSISGRARLHLKARATNLVAAHYALALWYWRAGISHPWRLADAVALVDVPELKLPAPRKPKPKPPPRNRAAADVDKWSAKLKAKVAHMQAIEHELVVLEQRKKTLKRRLKKVREDRRRIRNNAKAAQTRAIEEPTSALDERDYATRMRAKRQAQSAAPATR